MNSKHRMTRPEAGPSLGGQAAPHRPGQATARVHWAARWLLMASLSAPVWAYGQAPEPAPAAPALDTPLPNVALTEDLFRQLLLTEIAFQRGHTEAALKVLLDLARRTADPRLAKRAMEMALERGQAERGLQAASLWLKLAPLAPEAKRYEELLSAALGRIEALMPELAQQLAKAQDLEATIGKVGAIVSQMPDKQEAFKTLQRLIAPYTHTVAAHIVLARAAGAAEQFDLAEAHAREALKLRPDWEYAALLAFDFGTRRNLERAVARLKEFVQSHPEAMQTRLALARGLIAIQATDQARQEFETVLRAKPNHPEALYRLGLLAFQAREWAKAEHYLKQYVAQEGKQNEAVAYGVLAQIAEEQRHYDQAITWLSRIDEGEAGFLARLRTVTILSKQGKGEDARTLLTQIPAPTPPQRIQKLLTQAQLLREQGDAQQAFQLLGQEIAQTPDNPDLLYDYALLGDHIGQFDAMEGALRKVIALKPDFAHAYNALGFSLADRNTRLEEASVLLDKASALAPTDAFIMDSAGWLHYRMGKLENALALLKKAYALRPDPEIAIHLGEVMWATGDMKGARRLWNEVKNREPASPALRATLTRLKVEL